MQEVAGNAAGSCAWAGLRRLRIRVHGDIQADCLVLILDSWLVFLIYTSWPINFHGFDGLLEHIRGLPWPRADVALLRPADERVPIFASLLPHPWIFPLKVGWEPSMLADAISIILLIWLISSIVYYHHLIILTIESVLYIIQSPHLVCLDIILLLAQPQWLLLHLRLLLIEIVVSEQKFWCCNLGYFVVRFSVSGVGCGILEGILLVAWESWISLARFSRRLEAILRSLESSLLLRSCGVLRAVVARSVVLVPSPLILTSIWFNRRAQQLTLECTRIVVFVIRPIILLSIIFDERRVLWALKISRILSARPLGSQRQSWDLRALELVARVGRWASGPAGRLKCISKDICCVFTFIGKVDHDLLCWIQFWIDKFVIFNIDWKFNEKKSAQFGIELNLKIWR